MLNPGSQQDEHLLLDAVLDNNDMLIFVLDTDGRIHRFNSTCERASGYQFHEVKGRYIWDCQFFPEENACCSQKSFNALKTGESDQLKITGHYWAHKNGAHRLIDWNRIPLRDSAGELKFLIVLGTDVTRNTDLMMAIQTREAETFALFEQAAIGIAYVAPDGRMIDINPRLCEILGYDYDVLIKTTFQAITHPDDLKQSRELAEKTLRAVNSTYSIEKRFFRADGSFVWVNKTVSLVKHADGSPNYFIVLTRDITPRKTAESLLQVSERQLREAQHIIHLGSWELDLNANRLYWSDEIYQIFELDKDNFSPSYETFLNTIHPGDREVVNAAYTQSLQDKTPYEITHRLLMPDGRIKWVSERCQTTFSADGAPIRSLGTIQDITEQKRVEQELRELTQSLEQRVKARTAELASERNFIATILDTISALVIVLDERGYMVSVNRACEDLLGYKQTELEGRFPWDVLVDDTKREAMSQVFEAFKQGGEPPAYEVEWYSKDGKPHIIARTNTVLRTPQGDLKYIIMTGIDITERKAAEQQIIQERDRAEQASRAKSEFLSRMSHELRTPMNAILGFSQLLETDEASPLNPVQRENVGEILQAGKHLLELINEILDFSRIESGHVNLNIAPVNLPDLLLESLSLIQTQAEHRHLRVELEPIVTEAEFVQADLIRVKQVIRNLLTNAVKYNRDDGGIWITCTPIKPGSVRISIRDSGEGISEIQQAQLFNPFERLDADDKAVPGTGIGLALSKRLIELMNGSIGVESEVGKGSTFWIELPCLSD